MNELTGKVAIVTGASRGIGAATARELAAQGAKVFLTARSREKIEAITLEIRKNGGEAEFLASDMSRYFGVEVVVRRCLDAYGRVDILVNNAGVIDPIARITDSDPKAWAKTVEINLNAVYYGLRAVLPLMEEQGSGTVINISSGAASSPYEGWGHYCAAKAGASMLTRMAHLENGSDTLHIVGLSPGTVATDMQVRIKASGINPVSEMDPTEHIPAEWPARAIAWLAAGAAAEFSGTDIALRNEDIRRRIGLID
ncbi:MAG: SDR family oxidoreductase [Rhodobacteraceae bacterium]|nr:SDR family oxidoreductase [Paracoccaceae bacterium]